MLIFSSQILDSSPLLASPADEALKMLHSVGKFLRTMSHYEVASQLLQMSVQYRRARLEQNSGDRVLRAELGVATNALGYAYRLGGKYPLALDLYLEALSIRTAVEPRSAKTASSTNALAILYRLMGRYKDAEPLYRSALGVYNEFFPILRSHTSFAARRRYLYGAVHKDVAQSLNSIGCLKQDMGEYKEASELLNQALEQRLQLFGSLHPDVAMSYGCVLSLHTVSVTD